MSNIKSANTNIETMQALSVFVLKMLEKQKRVAQKLVNSEAFKAFIEECKCQIVISKAEDLYWVIDDDFLIKQLQIYPEEMYSRVITDYYTKDNYANIEKILNKWQGIHCIANRIGIFNSSFEIMKMVSNKESVNTIVIPALLAQITGITEDLHALVPKEVRNKISNELKQNGTTPSRGEVTLEFLWQIEHNKEIAECDIAIFRAVMKNTLSNENFTNEDLEKYNKYRNKILHGDKQFLNYGTDENLIRSWLELNILIKVYTIYYKNISNLS